MRSGRCVLQLQALCAPRFAFENSTQALRLALSPFTSLASSGNSESTVIVFTNRIIDEAIQVTHSLAPRCALA